MLQCRGDRSCPPGCFASSSCPCLGKLTADHFHVHIVHVAHDMLAGMAVGQAHLLDDVINWVSPLFHPITPVASVSPHLPVLPHHCRFGRISCTSTSYWAHQFCHRIRSGSTPSVELEPSRLATVSAHAIGTARDSACHPGLSSYRLRAPCWIATACLWRCAH